MNRAIRRQIENSDADREDIKEVLNELEKLQCRYPDAYGIAAIFDSDELRKTLNRMNSEEIIAEMVNDNE